MLLLKLHVQVMPDVVLQWLQTYWPLMNTLFGTAPVGYDLWRWVMLAAFAYYLLIEAGKWLLNRWS